MYFVAASTSGGGVGSIRPCSENCGTYCLLVGLTGLLGSNARSFALRLVADGVALDEGDGFGVGAMRIGRSGAVFVCDAAPGRGPGEPTPLGPGLGAVPAVFVIVGPFVGPGLGTPGTGAGSAEARTAGAGERLGAALARAATAAAVGAALGWTGAADAVFALGAEVGTGGFGEGCALGAAVGAGDGCAVASGLIETASGATVATLTGAAGASLLGCTS
jgi:hypothetical protein